MTISVKICGLSDEANIRAAAAAGADYIGLVHFEASPRHISLERMAQLRALLPAAVSSVCVLVDPDDALLHEIASTVHPTYFQLHGDETPERVDNIRQRFPQTKIIKAVA